MKAEGTTEGFPLPPSVDRKEYERGLHLINTLVTSQHLIAHHYGTQPPCGGLALATALLHSAMMGLTAGDVDLATAIIMVTEAHDAAIKWHDAQNAKEAAAAAGGPA